MLIHGVFLNALVWWDPEHFDFSIQRHSCYTRTSLTVPSLPEFFYLAKIWWQYGWLTEGKGTAVFLRTECGRISLWPRFRRLCWGYSLSERRAYLQSCQNFLPTASDSSGQPHSVHNPAFYLVQGCQCKMDVSRWEGVGADCSTCKICTSHLKRS